MVLEGAFELVVVCFEVEVVVNVIVVVVVAGFLENGEFVEFFI